MINLGAGGAAVNGKMQKNAVRLGDPLPIRTGIDGGTGPLDYRCPAKGSVSRGSSLIQFNLDEGNTETLVQCR
jgi:hypothetical protein